MIIQQDITSDTPPDTPPALHYLLTLKLIAVLLLGVLIISLLQVRQGEQVLESLILDQTKQQALVFLQGLERQIQQDPSLLQQERLQGFLQQAANLPESHNFVIRSIYLYDLRGKVLGHNRPGVHPDKDLSGHYGNVLRNNEPYLGDEVEYGPGSAGEMIPKLDIIAPLTLQQAVFGGMEVELDLRRTMLLIQERDGVYESELVGSTLLAAVILLLFIALVVYRWLVRPVRVMAQGTALIANGRFDTRIHSRSRDELGSLAGHINQMAHSLKQLFNEQENAYMEALKALTKALEAKDAYTAGHSGRVAHYAKLLGKRIGLDDEQLKLLHQGALMHDLGKIGIADNILNKPGKLDEHEYEIMQQHPHYTYTIMRPLKRFKAFADIARWHHERWDGAGYPDGLVGEQIPLLARIVSIADTWDAMTGDRIYRKGMPAAKALDILEQEKGLGQWDPTLLAAFIDMVRAELHSRHTESP